MAIYSEDIDPNVVERDELREYIKVNVDVHIDGIFEDVHLEFDTKHGDITPEQHIRMEILKADLVDLVYEQVKQNLV